MQCLFFCLLLLLACESAHSLRRLHEWNSLFQSDASVHFDSDDSLSSAHDEYFVHISNDQYSHSNRRHPFILKFPSDCGLPCHEAVKAQVGPERHSVLNAGYAQVTLRTDEVKALQSKLGQDVVQDFTTMLPALKVERATHSLTQTDMTCAQSDAGESVFQVVLEAHEESSLSDVLSMLNGAVRDFEAYAAATSSMASVSLQIDPSGLVANQENVVTFEIRCASQSDATSFISASAVTQLVSILSSLPIVLWVERRENIRTSNRWATGICQSGLKSIHPMFESGLDGRGLIVGVSDTGIDMTHCQFFDANTSTPYNYVNTSHRKVVTYITFADDTDDADGHGTHVASTVAGKSNIQYGDFEKYNGNAREAKIAFMDIGVTESLSLTIPGNVGSGLLQPLYDAGARVSTHSWGSVSNGYTTDARNVDQFMVSNPDALVFFAAGNRGEEGSMSVGSPSTNKNGISVGASLNSYDSMRAVMGPDISASIYSETSMAGFSSQGPTSDGRIKPELSAPGWYTVAAKAIAGASNDHCDVKALRGTSMASPTLAGNAVLIEQYFKEGFYPSGSRNSLDGFVPSGALLKAMLIHSGSNMDTVTYDDGTQTSTGGYPSNIQGYGRVKLSDVLNFGESTNNPISLFVMGDTNTSSPLYASLSDPLTVHRYFIVTSATPPPSLRVTMTYTDAVGSAGSSNPLVNDLQLRVSLNGDVTTPLLDSHSSMNSVEMVVIDGPCASCNYTIEVSAASLSAEQSYALVATGIVTEAVVNASSSSISYNTDETIGENTWKAIIIMSFGVACLGVIVIYLHYFDAPLPKQHHQKTFEEEQQEQAAALRYYEEQHRQRNRLAGSLNRGATNNSGQSPRRQGGSVGGDSVTTTRSKKRRSSRANREMELAERSAASSRV